MNPNISILIVDDDMNKIQNIISTIKEKIKDEPLKIDQAISISEAKDYLLKNKYHLLISDLQMPLHFGEELLPKGGEILLKEIYRSKNKLNVPLYIIGLTQHVEFKANFNNLWKVLHFNMGSEDWKVYLRDFIFHITLIKDNLHQYVIETIFVEGVNDFKLLQKATEIYFQNYVSKFKIEYVDFNGGTNWVARKIKLWAYSLNKKVNNQPLKAIGLLDNDKPGLATIEQIKVDIGENSAELKTFSLLKTAFKYSPILKSIKSKGIEFHSTMEDLIGVEVWNLAKEKDWLELRTRESFIGIENVNMELLKSRELTNDEILQTLYKVKDDYKDKFTNLALANVNSLINISYLLKDCINKLKI